MYFARVELKDSKRQHWHCCSILFHSRFQTCIFFVLLVHAIPLLDLIVTIDRQTSFGFLSASHDMVDIWFTDSVSARMVQDFVYQRYRYTVLLQWSWSLSPWNAIGSSTVKNADYFEVISMMRIVKTAWKSLRSHQRRGSKWKHSAQFVKTGNLSYV